MHVKSVCLACRCWGLYVFIWLMSFQVIRDLSNVCTHIIITIIIIIIIIIIRGGL
jgi:hypothetical protein